MNHKLEYDRFIPSFYYNKVTNSAGYDSHDRYAAGLDFFPKIYVETFDLSVGAGSSQYAVPFDNLQLASSFNDMEGVAGAFASCDAQELYPTVVNLRFGNGRSLVGFDLRIRRLIDTSRTIQTKVHVMFVGSR
jgi:hypothetical protein